MVIRISRRVLRIVQTATMVVLIGAALAGLYSLGNALTPRDGSGRPIILSPSVWQAERYRRIVLSWLVQMDDLDRGLDNLLTQTDITDPAALYRASDQAQRLTRDAAALVQAATFTAAPVALAGLRDLAVRAAEEYWKAAEAGARWVGAPEEAARREALEALERARQARKDLEASRWIGQWNHSRQYLTPGAIRAKMKAIVLEVRPNCLVRRDGSAFLFAGGAVLGVRLPHSCLGCPAPEWGGITIVLPSPVGGREGEIRKLIFQRRWRWEMAWENIVRERSDRLERALWCRNPLPGPDEGLPLGHCPNWVLVRLSKKKRRFPEEASAAALVLAWREGRFPIHPHYD